MYFYYHQGRELVKKKRELHLYHISLDIDEQDDRQIGNIEKTKKNLQHVRE